MKPTLYLSLCTEFFDLDKPTAPAGEYDFFHRYLSAATGPILEPMCGTGRYLIPYLEEGFNVEGFDASPFMLQALRAKCIQKNLNPHVWEQFLESSFAKASVFAEASTDTSADKHYNLIFIPDSSFCLLLEPATIAIALQKMYDLLQPGGTFVFDVETVHAIPAKAGLWHGKAYKKPDGTTIISSTLPLGVENSIASVICRYELMEKTEIIKTEMEYFQIRLYYPDELEQILKNIGFKHVKQIEAYDHSNRPSAQDYTVVFECIK
jgi:SAM-dependent methyltransferase